MVFQQLCGAQITCNRETCQRIKVYEAWHGLKPPVRNNVACRCRDAPQGLPKTAASADGGAPEQGLPWALEKRNQKKAGRKPRLTEVERRNAELLKRNAVLEKKLRIANALIALQKKAHEVLGIALPESDGDS